MNKARLTLIYQLKGYPPSVIHKSTRMPFDQISEKVLVDLEEAIRVNAPHIELVQVVDFQRL